MARFYDIHIIVDDDCKEGYSVFVKADSSMDAINLFVTEKLYEDPKDVDFIDYIGEITEDDYLLATQHRSVLMEKEIIYSETTDSEHIKKYGQYFTNYSVANYMCKWACTTASRVLDPAVGNSVFLLHTKKINNKCSLNGYEIDKRILEYFGNPSGGEIKNEDYLTNGWNEKYDGIVCNPPYNRFQAVANRKNILESIKCHVGISYSAYTNLYILFLIKSLYQLAENGRLAYIVPSEFLNSKYGVPIKTKFKEEKLLRAVINFQNDNEMFFNATTTCCILLVDKEPKDSVLFYNIQSVNELDKLEVGKDNGSSIRLNYEDIDPEIKWRSYLKQETSHEFSNLKEVSEFCSISRGIATGDNGFFCMSKSKAEKNSIPNQILNECICRSADVTTTIFSRTDYEQLSSSDKTVYILDVKKGDESLVKGYIDYGEKNKINKKYLLSCRKPWYSMEQKPIAPIWVSSASRDGLKFVRNLAGVHSLTTFHSIFIKDDYLNDLDIIFCYFLTPVAQDIIRENRKELGNALEKFQPSDLKTAKMLDISIISDVDKQHIRSIYENMIAGYNPSQIEELTNIFSPYLSA